MMLSSKNCEYLVLDTLCSDGPETMRHFNVCHCIHCGFTVQEPFTVLTGPASLIPCPAPCSQPKASFCPALINIDERGAHRRDKQSDRSLVSIYSGE